MLLRVSGYGLRFLIAGRSRLWTPVLLLSALWKGEDFFGGECVEKGGEVEGASGF